MKRRPTDLNKQETIATLDALYTAASAVRGREAVKLFLRDLLSKSERIMLGRRIIIARMLMAGKTYDDISYQLKASKTTIGNVDKWLQDQLPGYESAVTEMEKEYEQRKEKKPLEPYSLDWMKRKYPLHFLFFRASKSKDEYGTYPKRHKRA